MSLPTIFVLVVMGLVGCGSGGSDGGGGGATTNQANPCATRGATYLLHAEEQRGGTCGPLADEILNIGSDGTLPGPPVRCDAITQDGCTARDTNCTQTTNGVTCSTTTSVTFTADGKSASGLITLRCRDSDGGCTSTYAVTAKRQ